MINVAVFASGTGSNFEKIADDSRLKELIKIKYLICDNSKAKVIEKAKIRGVDTFVFNPKDYSKKEDFEKEILNLVSDTEFIFLAGYMRLISPYFLSNYTKPILNLHPSLLPKHKGKDAIKQAFDNGDKEIGISIHYVNEELDGGEVIAQDSFFVENDDTLETITEKVHKLEHNLYPNVILDILGR